MNQEATTKMEDEHTLTRNFVLTLCDIKQQGSIPPASVAPQMVTLGMRLYLFGGADERQSYGDLHMLEIGSSSWRDITTQGFTRPSPRYGHSMLNHHHNLIVFGGMEQTDEESSNQQARFPPPPITFRLDNEQPRLWCHRGVPSNSLFFFNINSSSWSSIEPSGPSPSPRAFHASTLIYRSRGSLEINRLMIWGGATDSSLAKGSNDLHILDLETNTWLTNIVQTGHVPTPRYGHRIVYVPSRGSVFLFGGADDNGSMYSLDVTPLLTSTTSTVFSSSSSTHLLDSNNDVIDPTQSEPVITLTWSMVQPNGTPPLSRSFHSFDLVGESRLFVFAGITIASNSSDFYIFDLARDKWTRPLHDGDINLSAHGSAILHDKLLIFGGSKGPSLESRYTTPDSSSSSSIVSKGPRLSRRLFFLSVLEIKHTMNVGDLRFKIVTVGDSGVGKSCLLKRFVQDVYIDNHVATIGVDFSSVVTMVKGKIVTMQLWDTAGQERFGSITGNYYRHSDGFILVYDSTKRESFDHILSWINHIKEHHDFGSTTLKLLIGNKQDLVGQIKVSDDEAKSLADSIGAIYLGTSARTGAGVDTAFLLAAGQLVDFRRRTSSQPKGFSPTGDVSLNNAAGNSSVFNTGFCSAC